MNTISRAVRAGAMVSCVNVEKGRQYACEAQTAPDKHFWRVSGNGTGPAARLERVGVPYLFPPLLTSPLCLVTPLPYLLFMSFLCTNQERKTKVRENRTLMTYMMRCNACFTHGR